MTAEEQRTRLIGEIARVLRDDPVPDDARRAALTLIGWLARRMPGEPASIDGVSEMIRRAAALEHAAEHAAGHTAGHATEAPASPASRPSGKGSRSR